jgi:hypothetical protein
MGGAIFGGDDMATRRRVSPWLLIAILLVLVVLWYGGTLLAPRP